MYGISIITPPATVPVAALELRTWLRLYDSSEDITLTDLLAGATDLFEHDTGRPVLATTYRQDLSRWPGGLVGYGPYGPIAMGAFPQFLAGWPGLGLWPGQTVVLGRGGVTAVSAVRRYLADGSTEDIDTADWRADLATPPARLHLSTTPPPVNTPAGITVTPVGCVEFTAGWADAASVPALVKMGIKLLAGHWYQHREAYEDGTLTEVPIGWSRLVTRYKTGLTGDWGQ